ncbi:cell division protein FtsA [uncultured Aquimarina sp.]|uniref:cell division protein FtsA n=1 Tax=uncultured Aquimarina sp. TaxID=575652 RepID=UPI00260CE7C9|nr:cell division protein FtsA [uncultured Aquimarina sp.]
MPHKLSLIKEQVIPSAGWNQFANNPYDEGKIGDITDNMGVSEVPVTSIPSPFAQMHLFETSFSFVNKAYMNSGKNATALSGNTTYHKYISHCLDIFEILFCYDTLKLKGKIEIEVWKAEELKRLQQDHNPGIRTFAETLRIFIDNYNKDSRFSNRGITNAFNEFTLIFLDHQVIAGTSPYTGFFTIGDTLPKTLKSNYKNRYFFTNNEPLYKRNPSFQEFMNVFFTSNPTITQSFKEVYSYIEHSRNHIEDQHILKTINGLSRNQGEEYTNEYEILEINNQEISFLGGTIPFICDKFDSLEEAQSIKDSDYIIQTSKTLKNPPLALLEGINKKRWNYYGGNKFTEDVKLYTHTPIQKRKLPQSVVEYPWITRDDLLSKHLIQLDYPANKAKFWLPSGIVDNVILPIKETYFNYFTLEDLKKQISIDKLKMGAIVVTLEIPVKADQGKGTIRFERTYDAVNPETIDNDEHGALIKTSMAFGIYPFFRVTDTKYNDKYKILSYHLKGEEISYQFIREELTKPKVLKIPSKIHSRTRSNEKYPCVTNYLDVTTIHKNEQGEIQLDTKTDATFDAIHVRIDNIDKNVISEGILIPLMGEAISLANGEAAIAFDIGTSNSFVAIKTSNTIENLSSYKGNEQSADPDMVMLHQPNQELEVSKKYELDPIKPVYGAAQIAEFLPTLIGKEALFKFPIRSIINIDNDTNPEQTNNVNVLSSTNIPFGFGQRVLRRDFDFVHSNIKWGVTDGTNIAAQNKLKAFIEQLVWMGRNKLLSEGINPEATNLLWFKPLSMGSNQMTVFNDIWNELYTSYYSKSSNIEKLTSITESWAPYYSYDRTFGSGEIYMNLDIGGGTTDMIVFENNKPALTTSFRFAGNSLFESRSNNDPFDNGFVSKYESVMRKAFGTDFSKTDIIDYIKSSKGLLSTDLISYFFNYKGFAKKLILDSEFKLLFLIHNSAIFYHSFQILGMSSIQKFPSYVGVSGNGAKLLAITNGSNDLNRSKGIAHLTCLIVKKIFNKEEVPPIELQILQNPKESTAIGGIKGLEQIKSNSEADTSNFYISIGNAKDLILDSDTDRKKTVQYANFIKESDLTIQEVTENVISFFDYFFDELWFDADLIKNFGLEKSYNPKKLQKFFSDPSKISDTIREVINYKITVEQESNLSDSLFFEAIKAYLYAFSKIIVSEKINQFKGV